MWRLILGLGLSLMPALSFATDAISKTDDIVCHGGTWGDRPVYLRTEDDDGRKNVLVLVGEMASNPPFYFFEASFMVSSFDTYPQSHGGPNDRRWLQISSNAHGMDGAPLFANVAVDLQDSNLAATLYTNPPGTKLGDPERAVQIPLPHCEIIRGGNSPRPR